MSIFSYKNMAGQDSSHSGLEGEVIIANIAAGCGSMPLCKNIENNINYKNKSDIEAIQPDLDFSD